SENESESDSKDSASETPIQDDPDYLVRQCFLTFYLPLGPELPIREHSELIQRCAALFQQGKLTPIVKKSPVNSILPLAIETLDNKADNKANKPKSEQKTEEDEEEDPREDYYD